jgi:hypothetical protein
MVTDIEHDEADREGARVWTAAASCRGDVRAVASGEGLWVAASTSPEAAVLRLALKVSPVEDDNPPRTGPVSEGSGKDDG